MIKISIIGVGRVGSELTNFLITNPKIDEILLVDIIKPKVKGTIFDISHAYPEFSQKLKYGDLEDTKGSKIIVISAGIARSAETKTRTDLLSVNKKIIKDILHSIKFSPGTSLIITTNPVEPLTYFAQKSTGLSPGKVIGFSNILDSERLRHIISKKTKTEANKIKCLVIGEHGENMIPVFSKCFIGGKPIFNFRLNLEEITNELKNSSKEILDSVGFTQFGPARHLKRLIDSILNNSNDIFPVSFYLNKSEFYGIEDVCISLPAKINKDGISSVENYTLDKDEKQKLIKLAALLKKIQRNVFNEKN